MLDNTKKLIIVSVVAIAVLGGAGYHLMQKMETKNIDAQQILSKSNNEVVIGGKTVELHKNKDYDILIKRAVNRGEDFLLRDILSEKEYQYLKTAYFKKIEDKLLEFEKKRNTVNTEATDIINQSKHRFESGNMTKTEYRNWVKDLKIAQTMELQKIDEQEDYFISKRPFLERFELVQLIDNYYKKNPNITSKNNTKVRSLTLSQILEGRGKYENEFNTDLAFDEILDNIKIAQKNKNTISLKDLLPRYEAELYLRELLNNPHYKTKNRTNKLTTLRMKGFNTELYGEYLVYKYMNLDEKSMEFKIIEQEVTRLFPPRSLESLKKKKRENI
jgi:hypothetical protein